MRHVCVRVALGGGTLEDCSGYVQHTTCTALHCLAPLHAGWMGLCPPSGALLAQPGPQPTSWCESFSLRFWALVGFWEAATGWGGRPCPGAVVTGAGMGWGLGGRDWGRVREHALLALALEAREGVMLQRSGAAPHMPPTHVHTHKHTSAYTSTHARTQARTPCHVD